MGGRAPVFTLGTVANNAMKEAGAAEGDKGKQIDSVNNYSLLLAPTKSWQSRPDSEKLKSKEGFLLRVGNRTIVQPLAKAIASRSKEIAEGDFFGVETLLKGNEDAKRLRVARLAHAIGRAHGWQINPVDATRPTRPFRCMAGLICDDGDDS